jgi:hypothetical protein
MLLEQFLERGPIAPFGSVDEKVISSQPSESRYVRPPPYLEALAPVWPTSPSSLLSLTLSPAS